MRHWPQVHGILVRHGGANAVLGMVLLLASSECSSLAHVYIRHVRSAFVGRHLQLVDVVPGAQR